MACTVSGGLAGLGCCAGGDQDKCMGVAVGSVLWGFYPAPFPPAPEGIERYRKVTWHYEIDLPDDLVPTCSGVDDFECTMDTFTGEITCTGEATNFNSCYFLPGGWTSRLLQQPSIQSKTVLETDVMFRDFVPGNPPFKVGTIRGFVSEKINEVDGWVSGLVSALTGITFPVEPCHWRHFRWTANGLVEDPRFVKSLPCPPAPGPSGEIEPFNAATFFRINSSGVANASPWFWRDPIDVRVQKIKCHARRIACTTAWLRPIERADAQLVQCQAGIGTPASNFASGVVLEPYVSFSAALPEPSTPPGTQVAENDSYIHWSNDYLADIRQAAHQVTVRNCCGQNDNPLP